MCKLLMIDDNELEHLIVQRYLDKLDLFQTVEHSLDAEASLNTIELNKSNKAMLPDLIFLDLRMPGFSGWDFLKRFQMIYGNMVKKIDVYVVSSSIDMNDILYSEAFDFVKAYYSKPLNKAQLIAIYSNYKIIP